MNKGRKVKNLMKKKDKIEEKWKVYEELKWMCKWIRKMIMNGK
jgi:hypothetical protein